MVDQSLGFPNALRFLSCFSPGPLLTALPFCRGDNRADFCTQLWYFSNRAEAPTDPFLSIFRKSSRCMINLCIGSDVL